MSRKYGINRIGCIGVIAAWLLVTGVPAWGAEFWAEVIKPRIRQGQDYFTHSSSRKTTQLLAIVEEYHLGEDNFWEFFRTGFYPRAAGDLQYVLGQFPNHPKALFLMGMVGKLGKRPKLVLPYYAKALQLYPQYALTHAQYGNYLVEIGMLEEGLQELTQAVRMDPNLPLGHVGLAKAYIRKGDTARAHTAAQRARELGYKGQVPGLR